MTYSSLSRKTKVFVIFVGLYLFLSILYLLTLNYVNNQLSARTVSGIYNQCHKIWATRGLVTEGDLRHTSSGNSIKTVQRAFSSGAKGSEIDVFFDPKLNQYIVSHNFPYRLKEGKLLSLQELLNEIGSEYYIWLDLKKLGHLTTNEVEAGVARLQEISKLTDNKDKLYIEGEDPFNLGIYRDAGFNTIFDSQPLVEGSWGSSFVMNVYKLAYYFGDFSVLAMNFEKRGIPIYGENAELALRNVPLFIYHVPDKVPILERLSAISNIRVVLNTDQSANRFDLNSCDR